MAEIKAELTGSDVQLVEFKEGSNIISWTDKDVYMLAIGGNKIIN